MSQNQIFCVFPTAMDLVLNYFAKFIARGKGYVTRQQLWIANVVRTIENQTGFTCFCLDKRLGVSGAVRYRSMMKNQVYKLKANQNEPSSTDEKEHQLRNQQGRGVSSTRNARLQFKSTCTTPGFLLAHRNRAEKSDAATKEKKSQAYRV